MADLQPKGYQVVEIARGKRWAMPHLFKSQERAQEEIRRIRRGRSAAVLEVEPVYPVDHDAERAAVILGLAQKVERRRYRLYRVPSKSTPGQWYDVVENLSGSIACNCQASLTGNLCNHVRALLVRREIEELAADVADDGLPQSVIVDTVRAKLIRALRIEREERERAAEVAKNEADAAPTIAAARPQPQPAKSEHVPYWEGGAVAVAERVTKRVALL